MHAGNGFGSVFSDEIDEMLAFDALPKSIRKALNYAPVNVSAVSTLHVYSEIPARCGGKALGGRISRIIHGIQLT